MRNSLVCTLLALAAACGGSSSSGGGGSAAVLITLSAAGLSPNAANAGSSASVHFVNSDAVAHQIASTSCPELATASIAAGKDAFVQLGAGPKTCSYDDALRPSATAFQGTINVAAPGMPGY